MCYDILGMAKLERFLFVELVAMHCDQLFNDSLSCFPFAFRIYGAGGCLDVRFVPSSCVLCRFGESGG
jgi:hypothetical protein